MAQRLKHRGLDLADMLKDCSIELVADIDERDGIKKCILGDLPKKGLYDIFIDFLIEELNPFEDRNLSYKELRCAIADAYTAASSPSLMKIYVARSGGEDLDKARKSGEEKQWD